jgi:hypothetical protein
MRVREGRESQCLTGEQRRRKRSAAAGATADGGTDASPGRGSRESVRARACVLVLVQPSMRLSDSCVHLGLTQSPVRLVSPCVLIAQLNPSIY